MHSFLLLTYILLQGPNWEFRKVEEKDKIISSPAEFTYLEKEKVVLLHFILL
jgi:hypothetical protein